MHHVNHHAYCGMLVPLGEYETLAEARQRAAKRLRWARNEGCPITKLGYHEWDVGEPDDCLMVPDFCGVLVIEEAQPEPEPECDHDWVFTDDDENRGRCYCSLCGEDGDG